MGSSFLRVPCCTLLTNFMRIWPVVFPVILLTNGQSDQTEKQQPFLFKHRDKCNGNRNTLLWHVSNSLSVVQVIVTQKHQHVFWFQLLGCEDFLRFSVFYRFRLNKFGTAGQTKHAISDHFRVFASELNGESRLQANTCIRTHVHKVRLWVGHCAFYLILLSSSSSLRLYKKPI